MNITRLVAHLRAKAGLSQRDLARLAGMSQPAIARLESGRATPTFATLERLARAAGFELRVDLVAAAPADPLVNAFKRDVDRTLLRENLKKSVEHRIRSMAESQEGIRELRRAMRTGEKEP